MRILKVLGVLLLILILAIPALASDETLIHNNDIENGAFGGPGIKIAPINGQTGILVGGYGGWLVNHSFIIGGGGYGLVNNLNIPDQIQTQYPGEDLHLNFGYGGLVLGYIDHPEKLTHLEYRILMGGGYLNYSSHTGSSCFVVEPGIGLMVNVTESLRVNLETSYLFVNGMKSNTTGISDANLSGLSANIIFIVGRF